MDSRVLCGQMGSRSAILCKRLCIFGRSDDSGKHLNGFTKAHFICENATTSLQRLFVTFTAGNDVYETALGLALSIENVQSLTYYHYHCFWASTENILQE